MNVDNTLTLYNNFYRQKNFPIPLVINVHICLWPRSCKSYFLFRLPFNENKNRHHFNEQLFYYIFNNSFINSMYYKGSFLLLFGKTIFVRRVIQSKNWLVFHRTFSSNNLIQYQLMFLLLINLDLNWNDNIGIFIPLTTDRMNDDYCSCRQYKLQSMLKKTRYIMSTAVVLIICLTRDKGLWLSIKRNPKYCV